MANNLGIPTTYRDIFKLLSKNEFIDKALEKELSRLVFYRNLLSHEYYDLTNKDIFDLLGRIVVIKQFVEKIKRLLR